jgi:hypothetical protein
MGFIPSIELNEALTRSGVGLWVERLGDGRIDLVCKAPETAIKALRFRATAAVSANTNSRNHSCWPFSA